MGADRTCLQDTEQAGSELGTERQDSRERASLIAALRLSLNQLTDHGSQKCLDCLRHRQSGVEAVDEIERVIRDVVAEHDLPASVEARLLGLMGE